MEKKKKVNDDRPCTAVSIHISEFGIPTTESTLLVYELAFFFFFFSKRNLIKREYISVFIPHRIDGLGQNEDEQRNTVVGRRRVKIYVYVIRYAQKARVERAKERTPASRPLMSLITSLRLHSILIVIIRLTGRSFR